MKASALIKDIETMVERFGDLDCVTDDGATFELEPAWHKKDGNCPDFFQLNIHDRGEEG